ncbi:hypothetical protein GJ496_009795 [Pomphorhynchus laevis]|nr:hypothetical protein GJ496_009795 [Pomphorhynchus laevis]
MSNNELPINTASAIATKKRARTFDIDAITEEAIIIARRRCIDSGVTNKPHEDEEECTQFLSSIDSYADDVITHDSSTKFNNSSSCSDTDDDESTETNHSTEESDQSLLPNNYRVMLQHSVGKPITALSLDGVGERLVSGGVDCNVSIWDFQCLDPEQPYRSLQPCGAHQIRQLDFGDRNDFFIVVASCAQAKILDRTGKECVECVKGDQYLVDMGKTKGHVSALNGGQWNPFIKEEFMTYGDDSTIRLWRTDDAKLNNTSLIKVKPLPGVAGKRHASVQSCLYTRSGQLLYASAEDGGMYGWDKRRSLLTPVLKLKSDSWNSMTVSYSDNMLATRSLEKVRLYDLRQRKDVFEWECPVKWACDVIFSPDDQNVVFGSTDGIMMASTALLDSKIRYGLKNLNQIVRRIKWHPRIYQIFCGNHYGTIEAMCDNSPGSRSQRGILRGVRNATKVSEKKEFFSNELVINPLALPMFRQEKVRNLSLLRTRQRNSAAKSRRPELPISGAGENGRIGHHGSTLSSYIVKNIALQQVPGTKEDPRAELLKYSSIAEKEPYWVSPAYTKTQPKPIFRENNEEQKEE